MHPFFLNFLKVGGNGGRRQHKKSVPALIIALRNYKMEQFVILSFEPGQGEELPILLRFEKARGFFTASTILTPDQVSDPAQGQLKW